jgi:hypothetical protein
MNTFVEIGGGEFEEAAEKPRSAPFHFAMQALRWGVPVILLGFIGHQLASIGWLEIWRAKPTALSFYLLVLVPFFVQPVADLLIYRNLWKIEKALPLSIFLRKRYLNAMVLDYSGEAYFYFWANTGNLEKLRCCMLSRTATFSRQVLVSQWSGWSFCFFRHWAASRFRLSSQRICGLRLRSPPFH